MLKAIVCGAMLSLLFVGCSQKLPEQNLPECKSDEDKIMGCVKRQYYDNGQLLSETYFKNGKKDGVYTLYNNIISQSTLINTHKIGLSLCLLITSYHIITCYL